MQHVLHLAHQTQAPGADDEPGAQVADDGTQAQLLAERHGDDRSAEVDEGVAEPAGGVFHEWDALRDPWCVGSNPTLT